MADIIDTATLDLSLYSNDETYWLYNGFDCCVTYEIFQNLYALTDETARRTYEFSKALQAPVLEMNLRGLLVNQRRKNKVIREMEAKVRQLEEQLDRLIVEGVGATQCNWRSPAQLKTLLYDIMRLPVQKKRNANGVFAPTTDEGALEKLSAYFIAEPICNHLLTLRSLGKSLGFLRTNIDSDGRMRTQFNIAGTDTGRFASSITDFGTGTNLQNVTSALRSVFVADPGMKFANLDLEQGDSRNVGALCWNTLLDSHGPDYAGKYLDACESGDLHTLVCRMGNPQLEWGTDTDRAIADRIAFKHLTYRDLAKKLGHGCLTEDHEVLTRTGWVKITEKPNEILTWNNGISEFHPVSNWTDKLYSGNLHRFVGNSQDLLMTSDHRVPFYKDQKSRILHVRPAEQGPATFMPLGTGYAGGSEIVKAKLIAATMCDGHVEKTCVAFHFVKERKVTRLIELCKEYGVDYHISSNGNTTKIRVKEIFPKNPGPFMFNWTAECLKQFVDELKYWDGHISKTAVCISSSKKENLEWYQTFGRILGIGGSIQKPTISGFGTTMYKLQQNHRQFANGSSSRHEIIPVKNHRVLCPTVPSSFFYTRRNGKICVTGNSNYLGTPPTMAKHARIPIPIAKQFQENYFAAFPCIPDWHQSVFWQLENLGFLETPFGDRRFFFDRPREASTRRVAVAHTPQSMTAKEINTGILNLWRANRVQLLVQVHDSILFQFPEEQEDEIIPWALETLKTHLTLKRGRDFVVPTEAMTGWNWGYISEDNPDGLKKWKGSDSRKREDTSFKLSLLDF